MNTIFQTLVYQREKKHDTVLATIIWDLSLIHISEPPRPY